MNRARPYVLAALLLALLPARGWAWGGDVHRLINRAASDELPAAFQAFAQWADDLETLSTAPDERKSYTPGESIKHYIDIDDYPEFFTGTLPHDYATMVATYGKSRVDGNGIVPWAVEDTWINLVQAFHEENWTGAVALAADLGHYVADLHNPLHDTVNYNGQLTDNYGIHSRYESYMTGRHLAELVPAPGTGTAVADPLESVFAWIDEQYPGVDEILAADDAAKIASGGSTSSTAYYNALWSAMGPDTKVWVRNASLRIAGLWYSAWLQAGSPLMPGQVAVGDGLPVAAFTLAPVRPNPFFGAAQVRFHLDEAAPVRVDVVGVDGRRVRTLLDANLPAGDGTAMWDGRDSEGRPASAGVYLIHMAAGAQTGVTRAVLLR